MIPNTSFRILKRRSRIISKSHDPSLRDIMRKKVSQPQLLRFRFRPRSELLAVETMDCNDTLKGQIR